jgi:hypothetical protein
MKLTKAQKNELIEFGWDIVEIEAEGRKQNCSWISVNPEDGVIFNETISHFGLSGEGNCIKLLVIGTIEESEEE